MYTLNRQKADLLGGYYVVFVSIVQDRQILIKLRVIDLPPEPKGWKSILKHRFTIE